jgi:hypothetical protein
MVLMSYWNQVPLFKIENLHSSRVKDKVPHSSDTLVQSNKINNHCRHHSENIKNHTQILETLIMSEHISYCGNKPERPKQRECLKIYKTEINKNEYHGITITYCIITQSFYLFQCANNVMKYIYMKNLYK